MPTTTNLEVFEKLCELERLAETFCEEYAEPLFTIRQEKKQALWRLNHPDAPPTPAEAYKRLLATDKSHNYGSYEDQVENHYKSTRL